MTEAAGVATVREAVAVLESVAELEAAVAELLAAGFAEGDVSLLAGREAVERKLGRMYRRVEELEDDPEAPRAAYVSIRNVGDREDRVVSTLNVLPTLAAAGTVVASAGAVAAAVVGAAVAGTALSGLFSHFMNRGQADWLQGQLDRGGLLLWVRTADAGRERSALEILGRHAAHDVHIHEIPVPVAA